MTHTQAKRPPAFFISREEGHYERTPSFSLRASVMEALERQEECVRFEAYDHANASFTLLMDHEQRAAVVRHLHHPKIYGLYTIKMWPWSHMSYLGDLDKLTTCWRTAEGRIRKKALWRVMEDGIRERLTEFLGILQKRYDLACSHLEGYAEELKELTDYQVIVEGPENPQENETWASMALVRRAVAAADPDELLRIFDEAYAERSSR